ncbi:hypothetical protein PBI_DAOB_68 [Arthrobacter phage Daob]|uniref:Uncharacterized protein n=1 Tax=Arthrobacter phage Daob TaxID=2419954 RepID=A0A3G2KFK9_9CAUD|nr:hypothetical protein PBI_DAOB_68 [Arthrobacter phage Daob]
MGHHGVVRGLAVEGAQVVLPSGLRRRGGPVIGRALCRLGWHKWALWLGHSTFNVRWKWSCVRCGEECK